MTSYKDAVNALAESISDPGLSKQEKIEGARSILSRGEMENKRKDLSIDISDEAFTVLRNYLTELQNARKAEVGKNIQASINNAKRLISLRDKLKENLSEAYEEDRELEAVARKLQDSGLGEIAGKEEDQINELGRKLEILEEKSDEVDRLESILEDILAENSLEKSGIDSELHKRASKVSRLLESHANNADVDVDSIVSAVAEEETVLNRAESKSTNSLRQDLAKLSELYQHKEQVSIELEKIEQALGNGDFDTAISSLDLVLANREGLLRGENSTVKDLHIDLEDSMEISSGLQKLFTQIDIVESNDDIEIDVFYSKLAGELGLSNGSEAKQFIEKLRRDYGDMKEELRDIRDLKEHSLERDKSNYEKIRQIDEEDSELRKKASSRDKKRKLKIIHEKLQELGYELENEISIESNEEASNTSSDENSEHSKATGPDSGGDPWIVSLSDVETNPELFELSINLVNETFNEPIVHHDENGELKWSGNNYKLIINGDLIQHGRHGEKEESIELIEMMESLVSSAEDSSSAGTHPVQFTVGNHDVNLVFGKGVASFPKNEELNQVGSFPETYQRWIRRGIVRMAISGHNTTYVHAGQRHRWDSYEINRANEILENISGVDIDQLASPNYNALPDDQGLAETTFRELKSMKERFDDDSVEFSNIGDLELAKLFGAGDTDLGNGSGKNKHAGMIWARPSIVKNGPQQVVGHTANHEPKREGNLIRENTIAHKIPSVVVEKPGSIIGIWISMKRTGENSAEWDKIEQKSL